MKFLNVCFKKPKNKLSIAEKIYIDEQVHICMTDNNVKRLNEHATKINEHTATLNLHVNKINDLEKQIANLKKIIEDQQIMMIKMNQSIIELQLQIISNV